MDAVGGRRLKRPRPRFLQACATGRRSGRRLRCGSRIGIGPIGKRFCRWKREMTMLGRRESWWHRAQGMRILRDHKNLIITMRGTSWKELRRGKPRRAWQQGRLQSCSCENLERSEEHTSELQSQF